MLSLRRRALRPSDDAGITLIEMVVAMTISVIVGAMAVAFFVSTWGNAHNATDRSVQASQARMVLQDWSQLIRLADSPVQAGTSNQRFVQVGPNSMTFYANISNRVGTNTITAPEKVVLSASGNELTEQFFDPINPSATDPANNYANTATSSRLLLGCPNAVNTSACVTRGTLSNVQFTAYYPATGCPAGSVSPAGLCFVDTNPNPSFADAIAVGFSFTITGVGSNTSSQSFNTLASITGASA